MSAEDPSCDAVILVVPKYSQLTLAALVEPMRMANTASGRQLYRWRLCSDGGQEVVSSSGFTLATSADVSEIGDCDALFVVASYEARHFASRKVITFLRGDRPERHADRRSRFGGLHHGGRRAA